MPSGRGPPRGRVQVELPGTEVAIIDYLPGSRPQDAGIACIARRTRTSQSEKRRLYSSTWASKTILDRSNRYCWFRRRDRVRRRRTTGFAALLGFDSGAVVTLSTSVEVWKDRRNPVELYCTEGSLTPADDRGRLGRTTRGVSAARNALRAWSRCQPVIAHNSSRTTFFPVRALVTGRDRSSDRLSLPHRQSHRPGVLQPSFATAATRRDAGIRP